MANSDPRSKTPNFAPPALSAEAPAERWNRVQEACDSLLIQNPEFENTPATSRSAADSVAPLSALEKWTKAALDAVFKQMDGTQTQAEAEKAAQNHTTAAGTGAPARPTSSERKEPAFLSADPRMRAALNRIQDKTLQTAKNHLRPGSKLIRPGLEGFKRDEIPVVESSDIKPNSTDSSWQQTQSPTTRVLRTPSEH
jgi:hypothetical protein